MNERQFEQALESIIDEIKENEEARDAFWTEPFDGQEISWFTNFDNLLTRNKGVIVRFSNGDEFHLTIVQSKRGANTMDEEDDDYYE